MTRGHWQWPVTSRARARYVYLRAVKNHDQRTSIWRSCNITIKRTQTTPACNQKPPGCYIMHIRTTPRCLGCCNNSKSRVGCSILKRNQPRESLTKPTQPKVKISYDSALYATQTHQFTTCTRLSKHLELPVLKCVRSSIMLINASRCMLLPSSMHTGI